MTLDTKDFEAMKEDVALSHRLLYRTGLGTTRGHTSARIPGTDTFLIKPWPHIQMHRVIADDLIIMDFDGNIVGGNVQTKTKVSEWPIHAELYKAYPEFNSILHTHQKWASMMAIAGKTVLPVVGADLAAPVAEPAPVFDEDKALIRRVAQGKAVAEKMKGATACHLQNHGMVFAGPNVPTVTMDAISIEYQAEMTWRASLIGRPNALPEAVLRPAVERRSRGEIDEAWEHYWRWVDQHPDSLRPRTADV
jgi:L-ribulose-5-phosphate 4-epimerase